MSDRNLTHDQELVVESHAPYTRIWALLLVLTVVEWAYALVAQSHFGWLVLGLVLVAVVKAALVGWYFMHLKFEGRWVFALLTPAAILATVLTAALVPDIGWQRIADQSPAVVEPPAQ